MKDFFEFVNSSNMNTTFTMLNTTKVDTPPFDVDNLGKAAVATTLLSLCAFGSVANVLTIIVIATSPALNSTFYFLIMSLAVSDLMSALNSPLFVYSITWGYNDWKWSTALCKIFFGIDIGTSYVTSLHILMFAVFRFVSIQWPHHFKLFTPARAKICISVVWAISLGTSFLLSISWLGSFPRDRSSSSIDFNWPSCSANVNKAHHIVVYVAVAYPIFYYVPLILVVLFSIGIALKLYLLRKNRDKLKGRRNNNNNNTDDSAEGKRRRKEMKILLQLGLIVGSFLVGYIPQTAYHFYVNDPSTPPQPYVAWLFAYLAFLMLRVTECFNPIFYNISSSKMRRETKRILQRLCGNSICKRSNAVMSTATSSI